MEGEKGVSEILKSDFEIELLLYTENIDKEILNNSDSGEFDSILVSQKELEQVGTFKSNNAGLVVAKCKANEPFEITTGITLALDDVKDPGNLGTIIRIADWYGIKGIVCSLECADVYNPKVINSSMGSFARVEVWHTQLEEVLRHSKLPIYGALLEGENIYEQNLASDGIIVLGSESHGISEPIEKLVSQPISIPKRGGAESLNVSVATAVILDNFFR